MPGLHPCIGVAHEPSGRGFCGCFLGHAGNKAVNPAPAGGTKLGRYQAGTTTAHGALEVYSRRATSGAEANLVIPDQWNFGLLTMMVYRPTQGGTLSVRNLGARADAANTSSGSGTTLSIAGGTTAAARGRLLVAVRDVYDNVRRGLSELICRDVSAFRERASFGGDQGTGGWLHIAEGAFEGGGPDTIAPITATYPANTPWVGAIFEVYEA